LQEFYIFILTRTPAVTNSLIGSLKCLIYRYGILIAEFLYSIIFIVRSR